MQQNDVLFDLAIFSFTRYSNTKCRGPEILFILLTSKNTLSVYFSAYQSVLFIYLKLEFYLFGKEFVTIFIALFFLSKLSRNSFFLHRRGSRAQENIF